MNSIFNNFRHIFLLILIALSFNAIELSALSNNCEAKIGQDASGNLIAVWIAADEMNGVFLIRASTWDLFTWSSNITLSDDTLSSEGPELDVNSFGNAVVAWKSIDDFGNASLWGTMYDVSSEGWEASVQLSDNNENIGNYQVTINDDGQIAVIWDSVSNIDGECDVFVLNGTIDTGWDLPAEKISD